MLSDRLISDIIDCGMQSGADLAEVFIEDFKYQNVGMLNGRVMKADSGFDTGYGIRLMSGTNVVYVYSNDSDEEVLMNLTREAASAIKKGDGAKIKEIEDLCRTTLSDIKKHPLDLSKQEFVDYLKQASSIMENYDPAITQSTCSLKTSTRIARIINSNGLNKEEESTRIRLAIEAIATKGNEKQSQRLAPGTLRGFEFLNEYPLLDKTRECCDKAIRMVNAGYAPSGKMPVVINNGFGGVIFHEACGHALESTSVGIKNSYLTDKLGQQIASPVVSARDNARIKGEWGSYATDDEGHESSDLLLIENGILKNYLIDELGARRMNSKATGCSRRESFAYAPTSRMSNTYICAGNDTHDDIIADTEYGLYAASMGGGSVDPATGEFNFAVDEGYMIRNGKIAEPVRGATLIGKGGEVLMNIDKVGNDLELSAGMCGSLSGNVPVTVGQPTIRVSSIIVGGRDAE
ncbi:MAG: TldD/PmbA family protein [Clostridiales bacterium]|nr:TldD/PmbA family protein [Clostridiales bacterium]